jgi:hypothetical protein
MKVGNNNKGSTLLLVVIAICFIGILGSIILSLTVTNIQMKQVDYQAKSNFYSTETVMDELKSGLEKMSSDCMYQAYNYLLINYVQITSDPSKSLKGEFDTQYLKALVTALCGTGVTFDPTTHYSYNPDILKSYIITSPTSLLNNNSTSNTLKIVLDTNDVDSINSVTLQGIKVKVTDSEGYETTIATDINIASPNLNFDSASIYPEYTKYALIADKQLIAMSGTGMRINGNIYAGSDGILVDAASVTVPTGNLPSGYNLKINGDTLITRGNITVNNSAKLYIGDALSNHKMDIWAENIETTGNRGGIYSSYLNIYGNCKVSDDLMLSAKKSEFILNGTYRGYNYNKNNVTVTGTGTEREVDSKYSSAILINGQDSSLDMSGVTSMTVAGRAFISRKSEMNGTPGSKDIMTGESVAVKSDQVAYFVPNEYIWSGHNPVFQSEIDAKLAEKPVVDFSFAPQSLTNLLTTKGYTEYHYVVNSLAITYYYLEFKNQACANKYFTDYYNNSVNKNNLLGNAKSYLIDTGNGIKLSSNLLLAANALRKNASGNYEMVSGVLSNPDSPDSSLLNEAIRTAMEYKSRQLSLIASSSAVTADQIRLENKQDRPLFNNIMSQDDNATPTDYSDDKSLIKKEAAEGSVNGFIQYDGNTKIKPVPIDLNNDNTPEYYVYIIDNKDSTFTLKNTILLGTTNYPVNKGIVVATGNLLLETDYEGLIISGGKITMSDSNRIIQSNPDLVQDIFYYALEKEKSTDGWYNDKTKKFTHYFKEYSNENSGKAEDISKVDISSYITYENWKKNGE